MLVMKHGQHVNVNGNKPPIQSPFEYLLPELKNVAEAHIPGDPAKVTADLTKLGEALIDTAPATAVDAVEVNSTIPAVYTYWGQFIDHDMTANTDRPAPNGAAIGNITQKPVTPVPAKDVPKKLVNLRRPTFDLDSVYGNGPGLDDDYIRVDPGGPDAPMYDGIRMRVGENDTTPGIPGVKIPPEQDLKRDLPRIGPMIRDKLITLDDVPADLRGVGEPKVLTRPFIGDQRNDENLILAQFHLAVLRFHNKVADQVEADPKRFGLKGKVTDAERFEAVQKLVRYHYQWLVVNDYLPTVTLPGIVDKILVGGTKKYKPLPNGDLFAPLEYSVAAFRFGHSMVRAGYDHNRNFGAPVPASVTPVKRFASFDDLFLFTGDGHQLEADITKSKRNPFLGLPTLPFNWIIEWDRMTSKVDANEGHFARKIDTRLAPPILNMVNRGMEEAPGDDPASVAVRKILRGLAVRNLLRGYLLSIPTGQAAADAMGVEKLTEAELRRNNTDAVNLALQNGGFLQNTPLWFYILKEAEVRADGNSLGELGSRIVVETQLGIMQRDRNSYLNDHHGPWDPSKGVQLPDGEGPIVTIRDFFQFAGLAA